MMIRHNLAQQINADIAPPPDAVDGPSDWEEWDDGYGRMHSAAATRTFEKLTMRQEPFWLVDIFGVQYDNGKVERTITADVHDYPMTAADARQLAASLLDAADELDRLTGTAPPF